MAKLTRPAEFGWHTYNGHGGAQDYFWGSNRNIYAAHEGTVELIVNSWTGSSYGTSDRSYGNYLVIRHPNGTSTSIYAHIAHNSYAVSVGDYVSAGQYLAQMNNTGYSNGTHLHFEFRPWGSKLGSADDVEYYFSHDIPGTGAGVPVGGATAEELWDGVSTLFKGSYDKQADGMVITVQVGGGPEGWPANRGNLNDINVWTQALANSKYAWDYLQEGGSYMTPGQILGGETFYAGNVYAIGDVVSWRAQQEADELAAIKAEVEHRLAESEKEAISKTDEILALWSGGGEEEIVAEGTDISYHSEVGLPPLAEKVGDLPQDVEPYDTERFKELEAIEKKYSELVEKVNQEKDKAYSKAVKQAYDYILTTAPKVAELGKAAEGESGIAGLLKNNPKARKIVADILWIVGLAAAVLGAVVAQDLLNGEALIIGKTILAWIVTVFGSFATYAGFVWRTNVTGGNTDDNKKIK